MAVLGTPYFGFLATHMTNFGQKMHFDKICQYKTIDDGQNKILPNHRGSYIPVNDKKFCN
jgi:hypothetical protein